MFAHHSADRILKFLNQIILSQNCSKKIFEVTILHVVSIFDATLQLTKFTFT